MAAVQQTGDITGRLRQSEEVYNCHPPKFILPALKGRNMRDCSLLKHTDKRPSEGLIDKSRDDRRDENTKDYRLLNHSLSIFLAS